MIELTLGRAVKWQIGNAWHTGRVLEASIVEQTWIGIQPATLVKDTCTSRVFAVETSRLQNNTCREDERKAEALHDEEIETIEWLDKFVASMTQYVAVNADMFGPFLAAAQGYRDGYREGKVSIDTINKFADSMEEMFCVDDAESEPTQ